jgi:hypothetical protein
MSNEPARMWTVFGSSGPKCLGFILLSCRGCEALDADGRSLGMFASPEAAAEAVRAHTKESAG